MVRVLAGRGQGSRNRGGTLSHGVGWALLSLVIAALVCHFLFYLVPGLLGMKTGLPLYIVGTSTFGAQGGFLMPGFLMGVLQFGWLGVNVYFSSLALSAMIPVDAPHHHGGLGRAGRVRRAEGHSVRRQGRDLPALIPLVTLLWLTASTIGSVGSFDPRHVDSPRSKAGQSDRSSAALSMMGVLAAMLTYVVGFFATAGAAGVDFGMNSRDEETT